MNTTSNIEISIGNYKLLTSGYLPNIKDVPLKIKIGALKYEINFIKDPQKSNVENISDKEDNKKMTINVYYKDYSSNIIGTTNYMNIGTLGGKKIFISLYFLGGFEKGNHLVNYNIFEEVDNNE